jgi:putative aldouronate transport system substrate-binding protein
MTSDGVSRRTLLGAAGAAGLAALAGPALAGCSTKAGNGGATASAKVKLPTYKPFAGGEPDLPGSAQGLDPGYLSFPKNAKASVSAAPGKGGTVSSLTYGETQLPPAEGSNLYWQQLNKRLGVEHLKVRIGSDDYPTVFNSMVAGDNLPDLVWVAPNQGLQHIAELAQAKFVDLTPHLSGDKVLKYPNLANIQEYAWKTAVINGKIWGVAVPYGTFGQVYKVNTKLWEPVGGAVFGNATEFLDKCRQITHAKSNRYALENGQYTLQNCLHMVGEWHGVPNGWRSSGGKLTYYFETDEYEAALEFVVKLYKAGVFFPDPKMSNPDDKMAQGAVAAAVASFPGYLGSPRTVKYPVGAIVPFGYDGKAKPTFDLGYGSVGFTAIRASGNDKRVEQLLGILDYLAAPFGSAERNFLLYGTEGTHYRLDAHGNPQLTTKGQTETLLSGPLQFLANCPEYLYTPSNAQFTSDTYALEKKLLAIAQPNPTSGHYSDTNTAKGPTLSQMYSDFVADVVQGRKPISALKQLRTDWRNGGGDKIRHEFEQSIAKDS